LLETYLRYLTTGPPPSQMPVRTDRAVSLALLRFLRSLPCAETAAPSVAGPATRPSLHANFNMSALDPYGEPRSLLYFDALPAPRLPAFRRSFRPRQLPNAPQGLEARPPKMPRRPPATLPRHQHVCHDPQQEATATRTRFHGHLRRRRHSPTSLGACHPRSSHPPP
jgi:hypothetical protein